jgi:ankyrin repeat protein
MLIKLAHGLLCAAAMFGSVIYSVSDVDFKQAITEGNVKKVGQFLRTIDPNRELEDDTGRDYGIVYAARLGQAAIVRLFLDAGATVDIRNSSDGQPTALIEAACRGHDEVVRTLIGGRADLNLKTIPNEWTRTYTSISAVACAANRKHKETFKLLIEAGAKDEFPLHSAVMLGDTDIVRDIIEKGTNINLMDGFLCSALMHAVSGGNSELVQILLSANASPDIPRQEEHTVIDGKPRTTYSRTYVFGSDPILVATKEGQVEIVRLLLQAKADPNVTDLMNRTPIWFAVEANNTEIVRLLIMARASMKVTHRNGERLLRMAERVKANEQIRQLLTDGAAQ